MTTIRHRALLPNTAIQNTSSIGMLDHWEIGMIAEFLSPFDVLLLRASCALCVASITIDIHARDDGYDKHDLNWMTCEAAKDGHRDLCELAYKWSQTSFARKCQKISSAPNALVSSISFYHMLASAAEGGHRDICELAYGWARGWFDVKGTGHEFVLSGMIRGAAKGTDPVRARELCELAREWGLESGTPAQFDWMLSGAAEGGHRDLCILAREWALESHNPIMDFECMLCSAVRCADSVRGRDLCILAREWGAIRFDWMFKFATGTGNRELCILARKWIQEQNIMHLSYNRMLRCAAEIGCRDLCVLAREWLDAEGTKPDFDSMLHNAAIKGDRDICELAYKWAREWWLKSSLASRAHASPMNFNDMLSCAAGCADRVRGRDLCILAREWACRWAQERLDADVQSELQ